MSTYVKRGMINSESLFRSVWALTGFDKLDKVSIRIDKRSALTLDQTNCCNVCAIQVTKQIVQLNNGYASGLGLR